MPKSAVADAGARDEQDGAVAIAPVRPALRLARRHRLSKARGVLLGVFIGLVAWCLAAAFLYGMI